MCIQWYTISIYSIDLDIFFPAAAAAASAESAYCVFYGYFEIGWCFCTFPRSHIPAIVSYILYAYRQYDQIHKDLYANASAYVCVCVFVYVSVCVGECMWNGYCKGVIVLESGRIKQTLEH